MYLGLWTLPFLLLIAPRVLARLAPARRRAAWLMVGGVAAGLTALLTLRGWLMPLTVNEWNDLGLGLLSLPGASSGPPRPFWIGITALSVTGAALIVLTLGVLARERLVSPRRGAPRTSPGPGRSSSCS